MASIIREIYYVINRAILDFWNWQSCPQSHYIIRGSLGTLTEGMQGWREALHSTLASPSTCFNRSLRACVWGSHRASTTSVEHSTDLWLLWSDSNTSTVGEGSWACSLSVQSELFPVDPRIDPSHTFTLLPEWWLYIQIRLRLFLSQCWHCKFSMLDV